MKMQQQSIVDLEPAGKVANTGPGEKNTGRRWTIVRHARLPHRDGLPLSSGGGDGGGG